MSYSVLLYNQFHLDPPCENGHLLSILLDLSFLDNSDK